MSGRCLALVTALAPLAACSPTAPPAPAPAELIGRVELAEDVPAPGCRVVLEGAPLGARCDETGEFDMRSVPAGRWNLRIFSDGGAGALPSRRVAAGANAGQLTDLGAIRLSKPGSVGGHVVGTGGIDLASAIITVPDLGAATAPNDNGGYLLDGLPPGVHELVLLLENGQVVHGNVTVQPAKVTTGVNFDLATAAPTELPVSGLARRARTGGGAGSGGLTVELVERLDGHVVASASTDGNGHFSFQAHQGVYLLRARDGKSPLQAVQPSLVVRGSAPLELDTPLIVPASGGDLDGDGVLDADDPDADGDGVPNASDAFPYDPAEWQDSDHDGIGDHADLRSQGGTGIDHRQPTPDSDGDGRLDFEDDCPTVANPAQQDGDGDGVGDACDDCPTVADPDQVDSVGNGIGDACRACRSNDDCAGGQLCEEGRCLQCVGNLQCGDEHCDVATHRCVPCQSSADCNAPQKCDPISSRCVACLASSDCGDNQVCEHGQCFARCSADADCGGLHCVAGACVSCRDQADCPTGWCDGGSCRPLCSVDGDCTGGRLCDQPTRTCVVPCNGTCLDGQACRAGVCHQVCDGSRPCAAGSRCSQGICVPECAVDQDCAATSPPSICHAGQCVASGACTLDTDCSRDQMCVSGLCTSRPTTLGKFGYPCANPCQCRLDEACTRYADGNSYCTVERAPTWFVGDAGCSGTCDGKSPASWSSDLGQVLAAARAGDLIALHTVSPPIATKTATITQSNISVVGGYQSCAPNRWVRDAVGSSTIVSSAYPVLALAGSLSNRLAGVTLRNLRVVATHVGSDFTVLDASGTQQMTLDKVEIAPSAPGPGDGTPEGVTALACANCADLSWSGVTVDGLTTGPDTDVTLARLTSASGTIANFTSGNFSNVNTLTGIRVSDTVGPLAITSANFGLAATQRGGYGIFVTNGAGGQVSVNGTSMSPGTLSVDDGGSWYGISLQGCPEFVANNNVLDGTLLDDPVGSDRAYFAFVDSSGSAAGNRIGWPKFNNARVLGFIVRGPHGAVLLDNDQASGGSGIVSGYAGIYVDGVAQGTVAIQRANISEEMGGTSNGQLIGLSVSNSYPGGFTVSDSVFRLGVAQSQLGYALWAAASNGVIERSQLLAGTGGNQRAAVLANAQVELYDDYLYGGRNTASTSRALDVTGSSLYAVANTLDGGGAPGDGRLSEGLACDPTSTAFLVSNLVSGGRSTNHRMIDSTSACLVPANFSYNYFQFEGGGSETSGDAVHAVALAAASGQADGNHNIVGGAATCFDPNVATPDYHVLATSACVDRGAPAPARKNGSAISTDIEGGPRIRGSSADVGCAERQ